MRAVAGRRADVLVNLSVAFPAAFRAVVLFVDLILFTIT